MPWKDSIVVQRVRFVEAVREGQFSVSELCRQYGISRPTGYKWMRRYSNQGLAGLSDQSRAPHGCPHRMDGGYEAPILELKSRYGQWGPRKIRDYLVYNHPEKVWPASSTIGEFLKRKGLVVARRRRRKLKPALSRPPQTADEPNELWTVDYKGEFRTRDRRYCYPLTLADLASRYLLECKGMLRIGRGGAQASFTIAFREYGLPEGILSDGGPPFANHGLGRLSGLSVWLMRLGIQRYVTQPGHPEQNGCHERMHRTLKSETLCPPEANLELQQRRFDRFRAEYNEQRPHEALGGKPPAKLYRASDRAFPEKLPPLDYPGHFKTRRVAVNGSIRWNSHRVFLTRALAYQDVGLEQIDDGVFSIYFGTVLLARFFEDDRRIVSPFPQVSQPPVDSIPSRNGRKL